MKTTLIVLACLAPILLLAATPFAVASLGNTIHPFQHGTTISRTSYPGQKVGCLTSGTKYTLQIDFYFTGNVDDDERITSLTLQVWDGIGNPNLDTSWNPAPGPVTWKYSTDGVSWNPYSGTGDIDVPFSGKSGPGQIVGTEPHIIVEVKFPVTGTISQEFYYRVHFTSYVYGATPPHPGNAGNHYFWYDICGIIPEFGEPSIIAFMAILVTFAYLHLHRRRIPSLLPK